MTGRRCMTCFNFIEFCTCQSLDDNLMQLRNDAAWAQTLNDPTGAVIEARAADAPTTGFPFIPYRSKPMDRLSEGGNAYAIPPAIEPDPTILARAHDLAGAEGKPTIPEVIDLFRHFVALDGNGVGGGLHIVIEDSNVDDHHVQFCIDAAEDAFTADLGRILLRMSRTQRAKIARRCWYEADGSLIE